MFYDKNILFTISIRYLLCENVKKCKNIKILISYFTVIILFALEGTNVTLVMIKVLTK